MEVVYFISFFNKLKQQTNDAKEILFTFSRPLYQHFFEQSSTNLNLESY